MTAKTVIITGSSRGIGKAIAEEFAKTGANIVLNGRSAISDELKQHIKELGANQVHAFTGDVSDYEVAGQLIKETKEVFGRVDVLVNNAGITQDNLLVRMTPEQFKQTLDVNLVGTFNTTQHVAKLMLKQRSGCILNISSVVGSVGNAGQANYAASKAGVVGLTKSTAKELASRGITVNALAPGFVESDMTSILKEDVKKQILTQIPLKRLGATEEIAQAAVFLSKQHYITGQVLHIDGGMVMNG